MYNSARYRPRNQSGQSQNRRFSGRRPARKTNGVDHRMYIQKAVAPIEEEQYQPKYMFTDFAIDDRIKQNIASKQYTQPTPIQDQVIPVVLEGKDVIGIANTGTGKTAAFLIPLLHKVMSDPTQKVLIIAPTRELATQIKDELKGFAIGYPLKGALCIGGDSMYWQEKDLSRQPQFVIGTPGRLKDLIERRRLHLSDFQTVVLDEVDRMVDIGFIGIVKYLISLLPSQRQSLFFSATTTQETDEVLASFVKNPITISVKKRATAAHIEQNIIPVTDPSQKLDKLHELLIKEEFKKVIVFGRTKWGIEKLSKALYDRGFKVTSIHGNKRQNQRERAIEDFKRDKVRILLATDVASRGLDIQNVTHVINYDPPENYDDYIHRIGRTGRANNAGVALTFVEQKKEAYRSFPNR